ncbi:hypothetical protein THAOC_28587, partial [Thalassiosira oceanica]
PCEKRQSRAGLSLRALAPSPLAGPAVRAQILRPSGSVSRRPGGLLPTPPPRACRNCGPSRPSAAVYVRLPGQGRSPVGQKLGSLPPPPPSPDGSSRSGSDCPIFAWDAILPVGLCSAVGLTPSTATASPHRRRASRPAPAPRTSRRVQYDARGRGRRGHVRAHEHDQVRHLHPCFLDSRTRDDCSLPPRRPRSPGEGGPRGAGGRAMHSSRGRGGERRRVPPPRPGREFVILPSDEWTNAAPPSRGGGESRCKPPGRRCVAGGISKDRGQGVLDPSSELGGSPRTGAASSSET